MAEQANNSFLQRCMNDFATGAAWVPSAPGPTGYARPTGSRWGDSPVVKWSLDLADWLAPVGDDQAAVRAAGRDPDARMRTAVQAGVIPALASVRDELAADGYEVSLETTETGATLSVVNYNGSPLVYAVTGRVYAEPAASLADLERSAGRRYAAIEIRSRGRLRTRRPAFCSRRAVRRDCLHEMRKALLW